VGILGVAAMVGKWMGRGVGGEVERPKWGRRREDTENIQPALFAMNSLPHIIQPHISARQPSFIPPGELAVAALYRPKWPR
jgi:hypothetical protein